MIACLLVAGAAYADERRKTDRGEGADVQSRVEGWILDDVGVDAARSGRVAPVWRDVERQIDQRFNPTVEEITRDPAAKTLSRQLLQARPQSGPVPRGYDASRQITSSPRDFAGYRAEQVGAARRAYEEPRGWQRVEIDAEIDGDGRIRDLRVAAPSGMRVFDRKAMDAVRAALEAHPPRDGHALVRWAVEAAAGMKLPAVGVITDEVSGRAVGGGVGVGVSADKNGRLQLDVPLTRQVHTRVTLLAIRKLSR
jgi:TonB family protein